MSLGSTTLRGQRAAEQRMVDTCRVRRPGDTTPDPMSGLDVTTYDDVYSGKCEVKTVNVQPQTTDSVTSQVTVQAELLKIPVDAPALLPGDLVEFDAATRTVRLRGGKASVAGAHVGTFTTAQRVPITVLPKVT